MSAGWPHPNLKFEAQLSQYHWPKNWTIVHTGKSISKSCHGVNLPRNPPTKTQEVPLENSETSRNWRIHQSKTSRLGELVERDQVLQETWLQKAQGVLLHKRLPLVTGVWLGGFAIRVPLDRWLVYFREKPKNFLDDGLYVIVLRIMGINTNYKWGFPTMGVPLDRWKAYVMENPIYKCMMMVPLRPRKPPFGPWLVSELAQKNATFASLNPMKFL